MGAVSCGCSHIQEANAMQHEPVLGGNDVLCEEKVTWPGPSKAAEAADSILNMDPDWSGLSTQEGAGSAAEGSCSIGGGSLGTAETALRTREAGQTPTSVPEEEERRDVVEEEICRARCAIQEEEKNLSADSWRDVSKSSAKILFKCKQQPARDCMRIVLDSETQVEALPMLETKDGKILRGAIPTALAVPHYPQWFPFCDSSTVLRQFSPRCFMLHCKLKILFISVDFVVLLNVANNLQNEQECVEITIASPPVGSEGGEWLGVPLPPKPGALPRIAIRCGVMRLRPTSRQSVHLEWQMEVDDVSGAPQWIKVFSIQQVALRLVPELAKMQKNFTGSPLDGYCNGKGEACIPEENLKFIYDLDRDITRYVDKGEAARES